MIKRYVDGMFVSDKIIEDEDEKERKQFLKELEEIRKEKEDEKQKKEDGKKD